MNIYVSKYIPPTPVTLSNYQNVIEKEFRSQISKTFKEPIKKQLEQAISDFTTNPAEILQILDRLQSNISNIDPLDKTVDHIFTNVQKYLELEPKRPFNSTSFPDIKRSVTNSTFSQPTSTAPVGTHNVASGVQQQQRSAVSVSNTQSSPSSQTSEVQLQKDVVGSVEQTQSSLTNATTIGVSKNYQNVIRKLQFLDKIGDIKTDVVKTDAIENVMKLKFYNFCCSYFNGDMEPDLFLVTLPDQVVEILKLQQKQVENNELKKQEELRSKQAEIENCRQGIKSTNQAIENLNSDIGKAVQEHCDLSNIETKLCELNRVIEEYQNLKSVNPDYENEIEQLRNVKREREEHKKELQGAIDLLTKQCDYYEDEKKKLLEGEEKLKREGSEKKAQLISDCYPKIKEVANVEHHLNNFNELCRIANVADADFAAFAQLMIYKNSDLTTLTLDILTKIAEYEPVDWANKFYLYLNKYDVSIARPTEYTNQLKIIGESLGFELIAPQEGDSFTPSVHSAHSEEESEIPKMKVVRCVQLGYRDADQVRQKAKVVLSRGK